MRCTLKSRKSSGRLSTACSCWVLGLAYLPISQRQVHQATYVETYKEELSELASVLADIKIEEESEEAPRMVGLKSDIESVGQALDEGKFEAIPNYRKLMYQDLDYFISRNRRFSNAAILDA